MFSVSLFFFTYTIAILFICVIAATFCLAALVVTHRRRYIPQAVFFIAYFIELSSIFGSEWLEQNTSTIDASNYYDLTNPLFRILIGVIILASLWYVILDVIDIHDSRPIAAISVFVIIAQLLIVYLLPYGSLRQWLFYTMRQVSLLACLGYVWHIWHSNQDPVFHQRLQKRKRIYIALLVFTIAILCEDVYVILLAPIPNGNSNFAGLYLSSRNLSENLMMIFLAYIVVRRAWADLSLRFQRPPEAEAVEAQQSRNLNDHLEDRLPAYVYKKKLSSREAEVLRLTLEGKSNREIASELVLAEGTIKTHLHNIMKKCGVANREELKQDFWAS